jgi:hypothetical protein
MTEQYLYLRDHVSLFLRKVGHTIRRAFWITFGMVMVMAAAKFVWLWIVG